MIREEQMSPATRELILLLGGVIKGLSAQLEEVKAELREVKAELKVVKEERDLLRAKLYGKRSEKSPKVKAKASKKRKPKPKDPKHVTLNRQALPEEVREREGSLHHGASFTAPVRRAYNMPPFLPSP